MATQEVNMSFSRELQLKSGYARYINLQRWKCKERLLLRKLFFKRHLRQLIRHIMQQVVRLNLLKKGAKSHLKAKKVGQHIPYKYSVALSFR